MNKWLLTWVLPLSLQAAEPVVVRSSVEPQEAWQGQRVLLTIEVLGKDAWAQIPNMPTLQVSGAYVLPADSQGVRLQEQIDGAQYTGQQYQLSLYPQQGGTITIPAFSVEVKSKVWGTTESAGLTNQIVPAIEFTSKVPPGAKGVDWLVSTESFSATQTWSSSSSDMKVGNALKRKVTLTANNVSGMAFKPLNYPQTEGLGIYPAEPTVEDKRDRGSLSGTRNEEVTYIFEGAGTAEIPAIELVWWDLKNQELKKVVLEGRSIKVTGSTKSTYADEAITEESNTVWWNIVLGAIVLAAGVFWKREQISDNFRERKRARAEHEKVYFERFRKIAETGDALKTQAALMQWLDKVNTSNNPAQLELFLQRYSNKKYAIKSLLEDSCELAKVMAKARKNWRKAQKIKAKHEGLLPEMNG